MLDWRRLTLHAILWHLGFYIEYKGVWGLARQIYRLLVFSPGKSDKALLYRSMAAAKLARFGIATSSFLEQSRHFKFVDQIRSAKGNLVATRALIDSVSNSSSVVNGLWSIADIAELTSDRAMARDIYLFLAQIPLTNAGNFIAVARSFQRLGHNEKALEVLDRALILSPSSKTLLKNKLALGLSSGDLRAFLNIEQSATFDSPAIHKRLTVAADFIAKEAFAEFAMRLPSFLSQDIPLTQLLIGKVADEANKRLYVFPFIEYVLVTMVRSGVPSNVVNKLRESMRFLQFSKVQNKRKNRILDISTSANFSYSHDLDSDLSSKWETISDLSRYKMQLSNPLSELPTWTPWVGAFIQAPRTPLWKTVSKLLPLVEDTWPIVKFVAPHTLFAADPSRRIRIGFLFHSSMPMVSGFLPFFAKSGFETFFIYPKDEASSNEGTKWASLSDHSLEISPRDLSAGIQKVSNLELDILISGPSMTSMWFLNLARVARIQAILLEPAWIDGSPNLDYYISWRLAEPLSYGQEFASAVALLDSPPYWIEKSNAEIFHEENFRVEVLERLLDWKPSERIYLCASTLVKLHPEMDYVIEGILKNDLFARVVFFRGEHLGGDSLKARLRHRLGGMFERVVFLNSLPSSDAHALLQSVHCVFDSFPITGMSSSFDGLKLGVPIVTLESEISFGKWTSAIYKYLGVEGLSTTSKSEFINICLNLAADSEMREAYSKSIKSQISKLITSEVSANDLVNFIKSAWDRYIAGERPADWFDSGWHSR